MVLIEEKILENEIIDEVALPERDEYLSGHESLSVLPHTDGSVTTAKVADNAITADKIIAGAITAAKISVTALSAITADLGTITAGSITLDSAGFIKGGQTAYNTGTGFWLGYDTSTYKFSLGVPTGNFLTWDGTGLTLGASLKALTLMNYTTSAAVYVQEATSYAGNPLTYTKIKTITMGSDWVGTSVRLKFNLRLSGDGETAYGRIYKNGVAFGTEQSTTNYDPTWSEFTEDLTFAPGDLIQLYVKRSGGSARNVETSYFQMLGTEVISKYTTTATKHF